MWRETCLCSGILPIVPYFDLHLGFLEEFEFEFRISVSKAPNVSNTIDLISLFFSFK
jgi:hypothetical protein